MAVSVARITIGATAVALNTASATDGGTLIIKNTSANAADIGGSDVAAGAGFDLAAGATLTIPVGSGEALYAIRSGGADATIAIIRI